jgi:hypothetical protein
MTNNNNDEMECLAVNIDEVQTKKLTMSGVLKKVWNWREDGAVKSRTQIYAEVYYAKPKNKFTFTLNDVRTINGIQTSQKFKSGFMSLNLSPEQSAHVRKQVDDCIFQLCFDNRVEMMKKGNKITHPSEMRMMFAGIVKDGDEKNDGSGERWQDQITCTVPTKRKGQQVVVDENVCVVEDLDGKPYSWTGLDQKTLKEVAIEIDRVVFGKEITVRGVYRLVVPDCKTVPRVMTKRKLQQRQESEASSSNPGKEDEGEEDDTVNSTSLEPPSKMVRSLPAGEE